MNLTCKIRILQYNRINIQQGNNRRIKYCVNRGLIYAITLVGQCYVIDSQKSSYKNGINYLQNYLNKDKTQYTISKAEIKRAMRPNRKRRHSLKIPVDIERIINGVVFLVDGISSIHEQCTEMNHTYACFNRVKHLGCYQFLVGNLIEQLGVVSGAMVPNTPLKSLYNSLSASRKLC